MQVLNTYAEMNGIDRSIGLRMPRMLRELGLLDIRVNPLVHVYPPGHARRMLLLEFVENARSRILEKELIAEAELDELMAALRQHLENPSTLVVSSLSFIRACAWRTVAIGGQLWLQMKCRCDRIVARASGSHRLEPASLGRVATQAFQRPLPV